MSGLFASSLFWFLFAVVLATVEIESEGKLGWAEKAPTWYRTTGFAGRLYGLFMGGKPLTGYHAAMFFMPVFIFHAGFFMGAPWSISAEFMAWAMYFAWCAMWDFLWFVLNPHYGVRNFQRTTIWWHAKSPWVFGLFPLDYLVGWFLSVALSALAAYFVGNSELFYAHLLRLGSWLAFIAVSIFFAPLYGTLYFKLREKDDRDKAGIFHN